MGVVERIIIGIGAVIFDSKLEIPEEDDFNANDAFVVDSQENAPLAFFFKSETLFNGKCNLPFSNGDGWSITDLDGPIYNEKEIIEKVIESIEEQKGADTPNGKKFIADVRAVLQDKSNKIYFGRFLYRYFG